MLESTVFGAALTLGFRHGFDWDHLAALSDLTGSQQRPRRALLYATLYALGHAAMVIALGVVAIVFGRSLPDPVDSSMEHVVGASLVVLGLWLLWVAARTKGAPPLRSRWMLAIEAVRRLAARRRTRTVVIEHSHPHDHDHPLHDHPHPHPAPAVEDPAAPGAAPVATAVGHAHRHRHVLPVPADPFTTYGPWSSFGVGVLHGIGAETPTQVLLFASASSAASTGASLGVLLCFCAGLVGANTLVAIGTTIGFRTFSQVRALLLVLSVLVAVGSVVVGVLILAGQGDALPVLVEP